ncbi:MAG TPA: SRPBCC family protein [Blastocatellia bacterium]|nr:SRPBCC family protein [Blastocatellia bacterium]
MPIPATHRNEAPHETPPERTNHTGGPVEEINGIRIEKSIIVNRDRGHLYRFWRNFENLPRIMTHLQEVRILSPTRSHWVAKAPAGRTIEWEAEITSDLENELIAWRSLEGSEVPNAGSVRFLHFAEGQTEVRVALEYEPPGGRLGAWIASLFGENPEQQIIEDLAHFKGMMEIEIRPAVRIPDLDKEVI